MQYCKNCNKPFSDEHKFCSVCGAKLSKILDDASPSVLSEPIRNVTRQPIDKRIFVLILLAFLLIFFIPKSIKSSDGPTGKFADIKEACPYDCCSNEMNYQEKLCSTDYECRNKRCIAVDSDGDGLTDVDEKQLGSNPRVFDTDSDGLNDYAEKQKGTNPNNQNTDNDRYNDNADPNPTVVNSASVGAQLANKEWSWDILGILDILKGDLNIKIATLKSDVSIQNTGNDYTEYVRFDLVFKLIGSEVKRVPESIGRLNIGETQNKHYEYDLRLKDVPNTVINAVKQKSTQWAVDIQNIKYEKF